MTEDADMYFKASLKGFVHFEPCIIPQSFANNLNSIYYNNQHFRAVFAYLRSPKNRSNS